MTAHFLGRTADKDRVFVTIEVEPITGTHQSVIHEPVEGGLRLSITGVYGRGPRDAGWGQVTSAVREITHPAEGWTAKDLESLLALWDEWHLNDVTAGCAHMDLPADPSYDARSHIVCPETGYKYGSAWLTKVLTPEVLTEVERLRALPVGTVPAWAL